MNHVCQQCRYCGEDAGFAAVLGEMNPTNGSDCSKFYYICPTKANPSHDVRAANLLRKDAFENFGVTVNWNWNNLPLSAATNQWDPANGKRIIRTVTDALEACAWLTETESMQHLPAIFGNGWTKMADLHVFVNKPMRLDLV